MSRRACSGSKAVFSFAAILVCLPPPGAWGQTRPESWMGTVPPQELVLGRTVKVRTGVSNISGELLTVSTDSLWVMSEGTIRGVSLEGVRRVQVRMHKWDTDRVLAWNLIAGLASSAAMAGACGTVDGCDPGSVFLSWAGAWALLGGITGAALAMSSHRDVQPSADALRPYVRYPQGMPPGGGPGPAAGRGGG